MKKLFLEIRECENGYVIFTDDRNAYVASHEPKRYVARTIDELKKIVGMLALMAQIPDAPEEAKKAR
jgi:hypothetical protein